MSAAPRIKFGLFELDTRARKLYKQGRVVRVQDQPLMVLELLLEKPGQVVTREEFRRRLWPGDVYVDFELGLTGAIKRLRQVLDDSATNPRFVATTPKSGYRFIAPVELIAPAEVGVPSELGAPPELTTRAAAPTLPPLLKRVLPFLTSTTLIFALVAWKYSRTNHAVVAAPPKSIAVLQALSEKDTLVISDIANHTGDAVFDDTVKQALSVELSQSPFLKILADEKISEVMRMMGRPGDERVNEKTALEICRRSQSTVALVGSIDTLGRQYVIGLNLLACRTGDLLAQEQLRANGKEDVLKAVDRAAVILRDKLGESHGMIEKFDIPVEQATTPSLEALQAYGLGRRKVMGGDMSAAVSAFQQAIKLDPDFAMAHARLGSTYSNLGLLDLAEDSTEKAFALRGRVSERERFYIDSHYHMFVTGSIEKGRQVLELWKQAYPRDEVPVFNLGALYGNIGQFDKALAEGQAALRLDPNSSLNHATLAYYYLLLNRFAEAQATIAAARAKNLDSPSLHITSYTLAFLQKDTSSMQQEVAWAVGKPGIENSLIACEADTAAYSGKLRAARELSRRAMLLAQLADQEEAATNYLATSALREALFGNLEEGKKRAKAARANWRNENLLFLSSLASAKATDSGQAQKTADELAAGHPDDTLVQFSYVPAVRAQIAIQQGNPAKAIEILQSAAPYELGADGGCGFGNALYPIYVRGEAYLAARRGREAAVEFEKILDHRGAVLMEPIGALVYLELGRAYAAAGDRAKAGAVYQNFLELWKNADTDIPILKQAKAEYAKLQ